MQLRTKVASVFEPITISSLGHTLGQDLAEDRHLWRVKCLKFYLARTNPFRGRGKGFLSFLIWRTGRQISAKNTISHHALLHLVYSAANKDAAVLFDRSTHASRSMAASLAFSCQMDMDEVLRKCSCYSHTTFSEFYVKDMTQVWCNFLSLDPVVAAQRVIVPQPLLELCIINLSSMLFCIPKCKLFISRADCLVNTLWVGFSNF